MGLFDFFKSKPPTKRTTYTFGSQNIGRGSYATDDAYFSPREQGITLWRTYRRCSWLARCVDSIARAASKEWRLIPPTLAGDLDPDSLQPLRDFLNHPNPDDSLERLLFTVVRDMLVFGSCYLEIQTGGLTQQQTNVAKAMVDQAINQFQSVIPNADAERQDLYDAVVQAGVPTYLRGLPNYEMEVVTDAKGRPIGYKQHASGGQLVEFTPNEIIHILHPASLNQVYGDPAIECVLTVAGINILIDETQVKLLQNQQKLDKVFKLSPESSSDDVTRFNEILSQQFRGAKNAGSFLVTSADVEIEDLNVLTDGQYLQLSERCKETIALTMGVPLAVLGVTDGNAISGNGADGAWRLFITNTVNPLVQSVEALFNNQIIPRFESLGVPPCLLEIVTAAEDDNNQLEQRYYTMLQSGSVTLNEIRKMRGQPPYDPEIGDEPIVISRSGATLLKNIINAVPNPAPVQPEDDDDSEVAPQPDTPRTPPTPQTPPAPKAPAIKKARKPRKKPAPE